MPDAAEVAQRIVGRLSIQEPASPTWGVGLPDARNNVARAFWRNPKVEGFAGFRSAVLDPATGQKLDARETRGGDFFYAFHFQFHYMKPRWGRWITGFCAMFMLVAIVSGVITHKKIFIDFFTFRWGKGQRSWLDAHTALSVFGLPFHAMITYTGLVTLMTMFMPWGSDAAFKTPRDRQALTAEMSAFVQPGKPSGQKAALAPVADMVRQAQARWGRDNIGRVTVNNPGDAAARVIVTRGDEGRVSVSPQYLLFDGATGRLLQAKESFGSAAETRGVMEALHLGRFADTTVRWLYFLVSLTGTAMVGTGLVLWTVKRRAKLLDPEKPYFGFRLLPAQLPQRGEWEVHLFFIVWALTLVWALARPAKRAWVELLWAGAASLALLPVLSALLTHRPLSRSLAEGDWVFAGFELTLWALAALHAALATRTMRHEPKAKRARRPDAVPAMQEAMQ